MPDPTNDPDRADATAPLRPAPTTAAKRRPPAAFLDASGWPDPPSEGARGPLLDGEAEHLLRVLRIQTGAELLGLDGLGMRLPLVVTLAERRRLEVEARGPLQLDPAPGEPGSPLPSLELACAWPSESRGDALLDHATQLGASAIRPLLAERSSGRRNGPRSDRAQRLLRESLKQCNRAWLPTLADPTSPADVLEDFHARCPAGQALVLDPGADRGLNELLLTAGARLPRLFLVGPEGGFSQSELDGLIARGALPARLGPHVLRIATAAEATLAVASCLLERP